jgi:polyisoprenoid-binding protein YceI
VARLILATCLLLAGAAATQTSSATVGAPAAPPTNWRIDTARSSLSVRAQRAGLLSPVLHDHDFRPDVWSGTIRLDLTGAGDPPRAQVEVSVTTASLEDHEPGLSPADRTKVHEQLVGPTILDAQRFGQIVFRANRLEDVRRADHSFEGTLVGVLTLHGQGRAVRVPISTTWTADTLKASGRFAIRQSDFGIRPFSSHLGTVAVRDELTIELRLVAGPAP